nr:MAG TPA: hypothetical protein [Caudoviricetes sp.]
MYNCAYKSKGNQAAQNSVAHNTSSKCCKT